MFLLKKIATFAARITSFPRERDKLGSERRGAMKTQTFQVRQIKPLHTIPISLAHHKLRPVDITILVLVIILKNLVNNPDNVL